MTRTLNQILLSGLLCGVAATAAGFTQPAAPSDDEARHLDFLQWEVGRWSTDITMYTAPDQPPVRFKGRQIDRMSGCGQWLVTDLSMVAGDDGADAPPYEGHGVLGWDPVKGKLVGIWVDSSKNWLAIAEGTVDESGDVLTLWIQDRHPQSGEPMVTIFQTTRVDADTRQLDVFIESPSGERIAVGRILSTRLPDSATTRPSHSVRIRIPSRCSTWIAGSRNSSRHRTTDDAHSLAGPALRAEATDTFTRSADLSRDLNHSSPGCAISGKFVASARQSRYYHDG